MANVRKTLNDGTTDWTDDSEITPVDSAPIVASTAIKKPNKKLIIILSAIALAIIAVALVIIFISSQGEAEGDTEIISDGDIEIISDGILYNIEDGKATVESFLLRYAEELTIPETINYNNKEYPVTSIGVGAFYDCTGITSIDIPKSVTDIGDKAFWNCSSLTSIVIPESVTSIGDSAFGGCSSLESITLPFVGGSATATSAGSGTLFGYIFGTSSYTGGIETKQCYGSSSSDYSTYYVPSSLKTVTVTGEKLFYGAFYGCSNLTSIVISEGVTYIGDEAFRNCSRLTSIDIPKSVTDIGDKAFWNCFSLTSIVIPEGVTSIGNSAFYYCRSLTSIVIPEGVTFIGGFAFEYCSSLTIYCEAASQPDNWSSNWNYSRCPVVWEAKQ